LLWGFKMTEHRETLKNEDPDTIRDFYFGDWTRDMDQYRIELYESLHSIYDKLNGGDYWIADEGFIVELGVNGCQSFNVLCKIFKPVRCIGFDLENVMSHPNVRVCDIRTLNREIPMALCVNEVGGWKVTPKSRQAAFDWAVKNIVPDGLLIEHSDELAGWSISGHMKQNRFTLVGKTNLHTVYRKR